MKIEQDKNILESNGLTDSEEFTVAANAHAFQILSSGVYTNKLRAPIRELCCNAFDAHTAYGVAKLPIEITLPTPKRNKFSVTDFGPGLSDGDIETVYSTYFKSTRQTSNAYTGGFGIGSKSPFAVADRFTVESRFNGVATTYEAYLDDQRQPRIRQVTKKPSTELNGLTVSFDVPKRDIAQFNSQAEEVFAAFDAPFIVGGVSRTPVSEHLQSKIKHGDTYWNPDKKFSNDTRGAHVLMGNIAYPLSTYVQKLDVDKDAALSWLCRQNLVVSVPVGSLSVSASREDLSYDKKTLHALPQVLNTALAAFAKSMYTESARTATSKYDIAVKLNRRYYDLRLFGVDNHVFDHFVRAGGWPADIAQVVKNGILSIFPESVRVAQLDSMLSRGSLAMLIDDFVGHGPMFGFRKGSSGRLGGLLDSKSADPLDKLFALREHAADAARRGPRGRGSNNYGFGRDDYFMHPALMEVLEVLKQPLQPISAKKEIVLSGTFATVPENAMLHLESAEPGRRRFHGFGGRNPYHIHEDLYEEDPVRDQLVRTLFDATKTRAKIGDGRSDGWHTPFYVLYPSATASPKEFSDAIAQLNAEWGINLDVGPANLSAETPTLQVNLQSKAKIRAVQLWNADDDGTVFRSFSGRGHQIDMLENKEPFLYITDENDTWDWGDHLLLPLQKLGAPKQLVLLSETDADILNKQYGASGRPLREFVENTVLPWARQERLRLGEVPSSHEHAVSLLKLLQTHPEGCNLPVVQKYRDGQSTETDVHVAVRKLLRRYKYQLPGTPDVVAEIVADYPFLASYSVSMLGGYREKNKQLIVDYIKGIDAYRNTLAATCTAEGPAL